MDIISHGLWGGVAFGRKSRREYGIAFLIGMMPDLFSFGILFISNLVGITQGPHYSSGRPDAAFIPQYVNHLYNITHSLLIFLLIFFAVWVIRKKPFWLLGPWGLHILIDIPSHDESFFPTPFLWPVSDFRVNGINWGNPIIYFPNIILLVVAYASWYVFLKLRRRKKGA